MIYFFSYRPPAFFNNQNMVTTMRNSTISENVNGDAIQGIGSDSSATVIEKMVDQIANDPLLLKRRIDFTNNLGVTGERRNVALYHSVIDSRLIIAGFGNSETLGLVNTGSPGCGKSYILTKVCKMHPRATQVVIVNASDKSFYHLTKSLKHKAIIFTEAFAFESKKNSELANVIRQLLSEGEAVYQVTQNSKFGHQTIEKKIEGPVSFITTTTFQSLERQLQDRLLKVYPDETANQTFAILEKTALSASTDQISNNSIELKAWLYFHDRLNPFRVIVPFAKKISNHIVKNPSSHPPVSTRRAFNKFISLIKSITILYQTQREKTTHGTLIASFEDYHMAQQIISGCFFDNIQEENELLVERLQFIRKNQPLKISDLKDAWKQSRQGISKWLKPRVKDGLLEWCDANGVSFVNNSALNKAKRSGNAYIKTTFKSINFLTPMLPSTFEITQDPEWDTEGSLFTQYDLYLES